jgi:hypothetical protein
MIRTTLMSLLAMAVAPPPARAADECRTAGGAKACRIVIDRSVPVSGRTVRVDNETRVTVVLIKQSPFESCKNDVKREELPDVSALPTLLGLVKDLAGSLLIPGGAPAAAANTPEHIAAMLDALANAAAAQVTAADALQTQYDAEARSLKAFYRTTYRLKAYAAGAIKDETAFEADRAARETAVAALDRVALPNTAGGDAAYKAIFAEFTGYARTAAAPPAVVALLAAQIDRARTLLDALEKAIAALDAARTRLHSTRDYLLTLKNPEWETVAELTPDSNVKLTGSFACTSDVSGKPSLDPPVVYTVAFRNTPRLSLTAGVLLSTVPRNSIALESVDDSHTGAAVTLHTEIRDHRGTPQAVPFSFINLRVAPAAHWNASAVTVNLAPGIGVNPNNGGASAEFFLGGAVGIGSLFLSAGAHVGHELRPANGFTVGDRPPPDLRSVPVETPWRAGLALAVSYRLPLK